jgi:hypothetical protein
MQFNIKYINIPIYVYIGVFIYFILKLVTCDEITTHLRHRKCLTQRKYIYVRADLAAAIVEFRSSEIWCNISHVLLLSIISGTGSATCTAVVVVLAGQTVSST